MKSTLLKTMSLIVVMVFTFCVCAIAQTNDVMLISENNEQSASDTALASDAAKEEITSDADIKSDAAEEEIASDADIKSDAAEEEIASDADIKSDAAKEEIPSDAIAEVTFADLSNDDWAFDSVVALAEKGIVSGDENGNINPDGGVTREEVAKMMVVARNFEVTSNGNLDKFADADSVADWAKNYVATAVEKGILSGDDDGTIRGNGVITRAEMATVIVRSLNASIDSFENSSFSDITGNDWYAKYVECAKTLGIVNGYEDGTCGGENSVTRREAFAMVHRLVKLLEALEA